MEFTLSQAQTLLEMFGGDDTSITVSELTDGHSGSGLYAYATEYPDEGSVFLEVESSSEERLKDKITVPSKRVPYSVKRTPCQMVIERHGYFRACGQRAGWLCYYVGEDGRKVRVALCAKCGRTVDPAIPDDRKHKLSRETGSSDPGFIGY